MGLLILRLLILLSGLLRLLGEGFEVLKLVLIEMVLNVMGSHMRRWCRLHEVVNWSLHLN